MGINISASLLLGNDFENKFRENAVKEIRKVLLRSYPRIQKGVLKSLRAIARERIIDSPEYNSMIGGTLRGELGLPDGLNRISRVIDEWILNIRVTVNNSTGRSLGSISISMIESTYADVLGLGESVLTYTNSKGKSVSLDWLKWLLI